MKRIKITVLLILLCVLAGCSPKDTSLRAYCTESQQEFLDQSLEELPVALTYRSRLPIITTITSWDATKRRMKKSSPKSCRHYGKRPLYPKLSAALQTAGSWSLRQRMGIPASSGLMKTGSMAPAEHPMCFPATRRFGIWRGKSKKHIQSTGKRWSKKGTSQNQAFLTCIQLRLCKQGMPGLFIPIFQTQGTRI